jgi:hypothetical protein
MVRLRLASRIAAQTRLERCLRGAQGLFRALQGSDIARDSDLAKQWPWASRNGVVLSATE